MTGSRHSLYSSPRMLIGVPLIQESKPPIKSPTKPEDWLNSWESTFSHSALNQLKINLERYTMKYGKEPITRFTLVNTIISAPFSFFDKQGILPNTSLAASNQEYANEALLITKNAFSTMGGTPGSVFKRAQIIMVALRKLLVLYKANSGDRIPRYIDEAFEKYLLVPAKNLSLEEFDKKKKLLFNHIGVRDEIEEKKEPPRLLTPKPQGEITNYF